MPVGVEVFVSVPWKLFFLLLLGFSPSLLHSQYNFVLKIFCRYAEHFFSYYLEIISLLKWEEIQVGTLGQS